MQVQGQASWFHSSSSSSSLEELHEKVLVYEELQRDANAAKSTSASVNSVNDYFLKE